MHDISTNILLDGVKDEKHIADYSRGWRALLKQKCALACFRAGSDDIVGVNMNYVLTKDDTFFKDVFKAVCDLL